MDASPGSDRMDWSPEISPKVFFASSLPFKSTPSRKFDEFNEGTEPQKRDNPTSTQTRFEAAPHSIVQPVGQTSIRWLGSCFTHAIAAVVVGAKRRFISMFSESTSHQRQQSPRRSSPRSHIFRQNVPTAAGYASTTPITPSNWRPRSRIPDTEERDHCVRDRYGQSSQHYQFQFPISHGFEPVMSGALQPHKKRDPNVTPEAVYSGSPRSLRLRQIPGTYPISPLQYRSTGSAGPTTEEIPSPLPQILMPGTYPISPLQQHLTGDARSERMKTVALSLTSATTVEEAVTTQTTSLSPSCATEIGLPLTAQNVSLLPTHGFANRTSTIKPPHDEVDAYDMENAGSQTSADSQDLIVYQSSSITSSEEAANFEFYRFKEERSAAEAAKALETEEAKKMLLVASWANGPDEHQLKVIDELASIHATMADTSTGNESTASLSTPQSPRMMAMQQQKAIVHKQPTPLTPESIEEEPKQSRSLDSTAQSISKIDPELNASEQSPIVYVQDLHNTTDALPVASASPTFLDPDLHVDAGSIEAYQSPSLAERSPKMDNIALTPIPSRWSPLSGLAPNQVAMSRPLNLQTTPKSNMAIFRRANPAQRTVHLPRGISHITRFLSFPWHKKRNCEPIDILNSAMQTPYRVKKSVAFIESPKTGRLVTRTKRYYIGESIDHPSPSSSRDESTLMSTPSIVRNSEEADASPTMAEQCPRTPLTETQAANAQLFSEFFRAIAKSEQDTASPSCNSYGNLSPPQHQHTSPNSSTASSGPNESNGGSRRLSSEATSDPYDPLPPQQDTTLTFGNPAGLHSVSATGSSHEFSRQPQDARLASPNTSRIIPASATDQEGSNSEMPSNSLEYSQQQHDTSPILEGSNFESPNDSLEYSQQQQRETYPTPGFASTSLPLSATTQEGLNSNLSSNSFEYSQQQHDTGLLPEGSNSELPSNSFENSQQQQQQQQQDTYFTPSFASNGLPASDIDQEGSSSELPSNSIEHSPQSTGDYGLGLDYSSQESSSRSMTLKKQGDDDVFVGPSERTSPSQIPLPHSRIPSPDLSSAVANISINIEHRLDTSERRRSVRQQLKAEEEAELKARLAERNAELQAQLKRDVEEAARKAGIRRMTKEKMIQPLSAEADEMVTEALKKGEHTQVAMTSTGNPITRRDIGKILPQRATTDDQSGWLNDEVISAYLQMAVDHGHSVLGRKRNEPPKYHAFNAFFWKNLAGKGYEGVKRWAKKAKIGGKDLENVEYVFMPINIHESHWTLAVVSPMRKTIEYFDSLHGASAHIYNSIKVWLKGELGSSFKEEEWEIREQQDYAGRGGGPSQNNAKDCGVFTATTAKMITLGVDPMAVVADDMPTQRRRMVAEILNGGFSGAFAPEFEFE